METEKVYQGKTARTIQQKRHDNGTLQFVDNRPMNQALQRVGAEDEEEALQGKFEDTLQCKEEEEEGLQMKADTSIQKKPNNTGLPDNLKTGIEHLSGFSMDDVRVHYNSSKPAAVQARAYTQGTDIYIAPGQENCTKHEVGHLPQQMEGRVEPTIKIGGLSVNDDVKLEGEADITGDRAEKIGNEITTAEKKDKLYE